MRQPLVGHDRQLFDETSVEVAIAAVAEVCEVEARPDCQQVIVTCVMQVGTRFGHFLDAIGVLVELRVGGRIRCVERDQVEMGVLSLVVAAKVEPVLAAQHRALAGADG